MVERLRDQEGLVASPGREYCKRVSVNFLTQIAQTLHRPAVASFVLVLLESRRRIGGENTEIYKHRDQVGQRFVIERPWIEQPTSEEDYMTRS